MSFRRFLLGLFGRCGKTLGWKPAAGAETPDSPFAGLRIKHTSFTQSDHPVDAFLFDEPPLRAPDTVALHYPEQCCVVIRDPFSGEAARFIEWECEQPLSPLFGDWNGTGRSGMGFYHAESAEAILYDDLSFNSPSFRFLFGKPGSGWWPLVGDWDGDGRETVGLFDPESRLFMLHNRHEDGLPDLFFPYGPPQSNWLPMAGNWGLARRDSVGLYDPNDRLFWLKHEPLDGLPDLLIRSQVCGETLLPIAGDWEGRGHDTVGLYDPLQGLFYVNSRVDGRERTFRFGPALLGARPLVVQWDDTLRVQ
jgi:hypothetical protein